MNKPRIKEYRRSSGAFRAAWFTFLLLSGLLGAGSSGATQTPNSGYSGVVDALFGAPSFNGITALLNASRTATDGADDGDLPAAAPSVLTVQGPLPAVLVAGVVSTHPVSRYLRGPSSRAPPLG